MKLGVVTCSTSEARSEPCIQTWKATATTSPWISVLLNGSDHPPYLGTVPAFRYAVDEALRLWPEVEVIACLHDDVEIHEPGWDEKVLRYFARYPRMGLAGFGGAKGLGSLRLYVDPYDPMQLARVGFRSDLVDAEVHGMRSLLAEPVACLDGFSQIGRRAFWEGFSYREAQLKPHLDSLAQELAAGYPRGFMGEGPAVGGTTTTLAANRPWTMLADLGFRHHFYDGALGCLAKRYGWETWYIPLRAKHLGGQTAVGDPGYQAWALTQHPEGDHGLWKEAHRIGYEAFRSELPIRV